VRARAPEGGGAGLSVIVDDMDEGLPIAYGLLEKGVPVLASDGEQVGTVHHVVAAPEKDIFHGLVISTSVTGRRFVGAADVASLHEHGVDLRIDSAAARELPEPGGGAPVYDEDPGAMGNWSHWVHRLTLRKDWHQGD
jgi:sporulation protein YlmC with PRC-barrel domain